MNRKAFYASLCSSTSGPFGTRMSQRQVDGCEAILNEAGKRGTPLNELSYILASAHHETGAQMGPVKETVYASSTNRNPSDATVIKRLDTAYAKGQLKGVDKPYWREGWFGRGLIQLTHKANYDKFGVTKTSALDLQTSVRVMFDGMTRGMFTGKKLSDFITPYVQDYYSARAVVNGDKTKNGASIAVTAQAFEKALVAAGYDGKAAPVPIPPIQVPRPVESKAVDIAAAIAAVLAGVGAWATSEWCSIFERFCQ